ncbi:hypothetical protein C4J81_05770 [Deltaproteobacteria bacterium Smac51]|nr:hypothetical protein C4J81_05770 [Deltaproteobacteria bacterium Smac51]
MAIGTMYRASTGMQALGTGMQTVSNNLANVNTVGYKAQRTNYQDLISQCYFSGGNINQLGKGSKVNTLQTVFNQGSFMSSEQDTDLAIAGEGFFNIRNARTGDIMYTRAGNYTISKEGLLEDPNGNVLQGWQMSIPKAGQEAVRIGNPVDIKLVTKVPPVATTEVTMIGNLNSTDKSSYYYPTTNDWEGMGFAGAWNGQANPPMDTDSYSHSESMRIYDEAGNPHDLMVYYQKNPHMENVWDYIVTCNPEEDARTGADGSLMFNSKSELAGLVQKGKLTFDADGKLKDIEAENFDMAGSQVSTVDAPSFSGSASSQAMQTATIGGYYTGASGTDPETGQSITSARSYTINWGWQDPATGIWSENNPTTNPPSSGMTWTDNLGNSGFIPVSDKNYAGPYDFGSGLNVTFETGGLPLEFGQPGNDAMEITAHSEQVAWSYGATNTDGYFSFDLSFTKTPMSKLEQPYPDNLETVSQTVSLNMGARKPFGLGDLELDEVSMTQYGSKSSTVKTNQDGYPEGSLQRVSVTDDGKVIGIYDKNRQEELYQITLTRFRNTTDLSKQGDNLFMPTRQSGEGFDCVPGEDGAGSVLGNFLEQSTVDTATEIVNMIMTQRGFQANSKSITTSDSMLATAIQTKK